MHRLPKIEIRFDLGGILKFRSILNSVINKMKKCSKITGFKPTSMSLILDSHIIEKADKLLKNLYESLNRYNRALEKSNALLKEQEELRKKLGIFVKNGKTVGLVTKDSENEKNQ